MANEINKARYNTVRKANDLIQKSRFNLSLQQQKIILFLISQITPFDKEFNTYEFDIREFCKVCGIDYDNGNNYMKLKEQIKSIADKSMWVEIEENEETLLRWIEKPYINKRSGLIRIRLDEDMKPYLLNLKKNYTQYELIYTLHFKSKYTIRLYELIKSIHYKELETYKVYYTIDEIRNRLGVENGRYKELKNLKARVLDISVEEINKYSDKQISYKNVKKGRIIIGIEFTINSKDILNNIETLADIEKEMDNQITIFDKE